MQKYHLIQCKYQPCSYTAAYQELLQRAFQSGVLREQTSLPQQYKDD